MLLPQVDWTGLREPPAPGSTAADQLMMNGQTRNNALRQHVDRPQRTKRTLTDGEVIPLDNGTERDGEQGLDQPHHGDVLRPVHRQ
jgi:hypothetical protein